MATPTIAIKPSVPSRRRRYLLTPPGAGTTTNDVARWNCGGRLYYNDYFARPSLGSTEAMAKIVAVQQEGWVVADIEAPRRLRRELREAILAQDLEYDDVANQWRIRWRSWGAAMVVFWRYQATVELVRGPRQK